MNGKVFLEPRRSFPFIETNNVKADCKRKVRIVYSSFPDRQAALISDDYMFTPKRPPLRRNRALLSRVADIASNSSPSPSP